MVKRTLPPAATRLPILENFEPFASLWQGDAPLYPSEQSARWGLRQLRPELAQARAVAVHRREILVHPQRFAEVAERQAFARFQNRVAKG